MYRSHRLPGWPTARGNWLSHGTSRKVVGSLTSRITSRTSRSILRPSHKTCSRYQFRASSHAAQAQSPHGSYEELEDEGFTTSCASGDSTTLSDKHVTIEVINEDQKENAELCENENASYSNTDVILKEQNTMRSGFFNTAIGQPSSHGTRDTALYGENAVPPSGEVNKVQSGPFQRLERMRRKVDLSHVNVRVREAGPVVVSGTSEPTSMRSSGPLRKVLNDFMTQVQPRLRNNMDSLTPESVELDEALGNIFLGKNWRILRERSYDVEDVMAWSWVLTARTSSICVRRYVLLSEENRQRGLQPPPWFLCLQILRLDHIDITSLRLLWDEVMHDLVGTRRDSDSAAIFLIRILRHARRVDLDLYTRISEAAPRILPCPYSSANGVSDTEQFQRVTHFYNRFLRLIALPIPHKPFGAVPVQQIAQLNIARFMHESKPEIPINREGYRAFIHLQLRHEKTSAERDWALAKGPKWPPWRQNELGIQANIEYPGQRSRVMKVLGRMQDAGYSPGEHEQAAQILAGWDTDMSPTIQVRRLVSSRPMLWLKEILSDNKPPSTPVIKHDVWAARVEATRSVREAWLCFHSYIVETEGATRKLVVYQAMFDKLLARMHEDQIDDSVVPGDGKEVYADTTSARDRVYIPTEPPSVDEFYAQMLEDDLRPSGRLLTTLVDNASTLSQGLRYIEESTLGEVKKDVLRHAEKYPPSYIRDTILSIPDYIFNSYIKLLLRQDPLEQRILAWPSSLSSGDRVSVKEGIPAFRYAICMLKISETRYLPCYNALFENLRRMSRPLRKRADRNIRRERIAANIWHTFRLMLDLMRQNSVAPSMLTFRICAMITQEMFFLATNQVHAIESPMSSAPNIAKSLFRHVLMDSSLEDEQWLTKAMSFDLDIPPAKDLRVDVRPECKDLELMFFIFAMTNDLSSAMSLLKWMAAGHEALTFPESNDRSKRQMLAAIRVALEDSWMHNADNSLVKIADAGQFEEARSLCEPFGWAADEEVDEFIQSRGHWLPIARRALQVGRTDGNGNEAQ